MCSTVLFMFSSLLRSRIKKQPLSGYQPSHCTERKATGQPHSDSSELCSMAVQTTSKASHLAKANGNSTGMQNPERGGNMGQKSNLSQIITLKYLLWYQE